MSRWTYDHFGIEDLDIRQVVKTCRKIPTWEPWYMTTLTMSAYRTQQHLTQEDAQEAVYPILSALIRHPEDESLWAVLWPLCGPGSLGAGYDNTAHRLWRNDIADLIEYMAKAKSLPKVPGHFKKD